MAEYHAYMVHGTPLPPDVSRQTLIPVDSDDVTNPYNRFGLAEYYHVFPHHTLDEQEFVAALPDPFDLPALIATLPGEIVAVYDDPFPAIGGSWTDTHHYTGAGAQTLKSHRYMLEGAVAVVYPPDDPGWYRVAKNLYTHTHFIGYVVMPIAWAKRTGLHDLPGHKFYLDEAQTMFVIGKHDYESMRV